MYLRISKPATPWEVVVVTKTSVSGASVLYASTPSVFRQNWKGFANPSEKSKKCVEKS